MVCLYVKKHENKTFLKKNATTQFHGLSVNHSVEHTTCVPARIISLLNTAENSRVSIGSVAGWYLWLIWRVGDG